MASWALCHGRFVAIQDEVVGREVVRLYTHQLDVVVVVLICHPTIATSMLIPLLLMALAFTFYFFTVVLIRMRNDILERERHTGWVAQMLESNP